MIKIEIEAGAVTRALDRLVERGANLRPAFGSIGELLVRSTKERFAQGKAPDGTPGGAWDKSEAGPRLDR